MFCLFCTMDGVGVGDCLCKWGKGNFVLAGEKKRRGIGGRTAIYLYLNIWLALGVGELGADGNLFVSEYMACFGGGGIGGGQQFWAARPSLTQTGQRSGELTANSDYGTAQK